ncbi:GbsR/MarR family transcriptional regulator [Streptomyces phaeochromogenes]|uniref:GbsR/MarR family transcriptional regulator n=1 Tax=Streptomyces phaeochromogenes TaxID=1923 RepID=UPI0038632D07|nr:helix-turn-helix domain-containing protein [Streptomyces phaeochromogenes]
MAEPAVGVDRDQMLHWVERLSMYLAQDGVPPIAGRILGWLMICDPPEQSAGQIAEAIGASRASLTTNLRILTTMGFAARRTRPGERTVYYRLQQGASQQVVRRQIAGLVSLCEITADGMALLGSDSRRAARIKEAHETFEWMVRVFENAPPMPSSKGE